MAKASNQITLMDLTDGYSVILTNDNYTFLGTTNSVSGTQSTTCQVQGLRGNEQVACSVGEITCPTGLSIVSDKKTPIPTLTITATSALTKSGTVIIPVQIDDVTISKSFSYSIAFTGAKGDKGDTGDKGDKGDKGDTGDKGEDALTLVIISSNGSIFKNTSIATTLSVHVYKAGVELTDAALNAEGTIKWYKDGESTPVATGSDLTIQAGDVLNRATYIAQLEG